MSTLVYSPGINIIIDSAIAGPVNVSPDASAGSLTLRENGSHNLRLTLENSNRKYDGMFVPNDRIVVQMKRFKWLQVFAGYLNSAPYFSTYPGQVQLTAECSLKVLKNWPWDRGSQAAHNLMERGSQDRDRTEQDGGVSHIIVKLLNEVTLWPSERIHIGKIPATWLQRFEAIYERMDEDIIEKLTPLLGTNPVLAGKPVGGLPTTAAGSAGGTTGLFGGSPLSDAQKEALTLDPRDWDVALATIRYTESGNNYSAINRGDGIGDWATGAYQFIDSTWANFFGYSRAYLAPPDVQDMKAREYLDSIMSQHGNKLLNVPYGWYYPRVFRDPSWLDRIPAANEGNNLTLRQYAYKWADNFQEQYLEMRGSAPPQGDTTTSPTGGVYPASPPIAGGQILYPIPSGVTRLRYQEVGWGGYQNGRIPTNAMVANEWLGLGHPLAAESYAIMAQDAQSLGLNIKGYAYRTAEAQAQTGAMAAPVGKSNHGWGLAIDISELVPNGQITSKYPNNSNTDMYSTPEYLWLAQNAYKYGWGHPAWAQDGGSKPEAWHWEFFAIMNYQTGDPLREGVNPFGTTGSGITPFPQLTSEVLFSALAKWDYSPSDYDEESENLAGFKALMNDEPILPTIKSFVQMTGRSYCAAPNGDFISWWPDYWDQYDMTGKVEIADIELKDFSVNWDDASLITHQFVEGAFYESTGPSPQGIYDMEQAYLSRGVATVEMNNLLPSLLNVKDSSQYPWLASSNAMLQRFGARVSRERDMNIMGPQQEFFMAVQKLTRAWASQFTSVAPLTFMPELFPGMIMSIPSFGVQMYVSSVTHTWNYANGAGFSTDVQTIGVSAQDGSGMYLFPKGGDKRPAGGNLPWPANGGPGGHTL